MTSEGHPEGLSRAAGPHLRTRRLLLREWRESDREPFAAMKADPLVMQHFPGLAERAASDAIVDAMRASWVERGYGIWVIELPLTSFGVSASVRPSFAIVCIAATP